MPTLHNLLRRSLLQLLHDLIQVEAGRLPALRIILERHQELAHIVLGRHKQEEVVDDPIVVRVRGDVRPLIGVSPEVEEFGEAQGDEWLSPDAQGTRHALLHEHQFPVIKPQAGFNRFLLCPFIRVSLLSSTKLSLHRRKHL